MRTEKEELGKVSLTADAQWDINNHYERLCLVHDGYFASYLSRKEVPKGILLTNKEYWQPIANLRDDVRVDYETFKKWIKENFEDFKENVLKDQELFKEYIKENVQNIWNYVHHLVPEVNWDDVRALVIKCVEDMVEDGLLKIGITTVKTFDDLNDDKYKQPGNFVYVRDENRYYTYNKDEKWYQMPIIYIGNEEPGEVLWIDPQEDKDINGEDDEELKVIRNALSELQDKVKELSRLQTVGIIPGNTANGYRRILMASAEPEMPEDVPEENQPDEDDDEDKPSEEPATNTVTCICCKMDTTTNFAQNKADLVDGELIFYTDRKKFGVYYGGKFYLNGSGGDSGESGGGISLDELYQLNLERLNFTNGSETYRVTVDESGKWTVRQFNESITKPGNPDDAFGVYISQYLCMNSIYCGGEGNEDCLCTYNYVEIANGSKKDINLKGLYLLYTDGTKESPSDIGYIWDVLELDGVVKAGNTFVIRGAECNTSKNAFISVDNYDMIWNKNNKPIVFKQGPSSFYLCAGESFRELLEKKTLNNPWESKTTKVGYIDSCGFGTGSVGEGSATFTVDDDWNKILFVRWFMLEPAKQGNKAYASRKTTDLWTYINLEKQTTALGNSLQYYYPDNIKAKYKPMASYLGKTFFTNKTTFDSNHANYINITFGIQATDNGEGATRCFNWVSVGYYDEYVEYRKKGSTDWTKVYSFTDNNSSNPEWVTKFIEHYKRFRWTASDGTVVTTHKTIIKGLEKGSYEYRIGRDNNSLYTSDILTFTVEADSDVTNFSFIHISDQQGFNWQEYTAWWKTSYMINKTEKNYNFFINTGDITQSGNRANEWLDYYQGKKYNIDKCEMFTIGNNDLCGHVSTELTDGEDATSKYSHINVLRYFCFELDVNNDYSFEWEDESYPIYSLYSFNYGKYHFVSLNSEIAIATSKMYKDWESDAYQGDRTFAENANAKIEDWFKKDLQLWKGNDVEPTNCGKCIVYMHEMPFTIVTWSFMGGESARVGSHLNTLNSRGLYRFSRLFKKYGIRVVLGGHKHTYSISKPIYDAPTGYIGSNNKPASGVDLMGEVTTADTRVPVIQVTDVSHVKKNDKFARYEVVSKIDAPYYIMSQASGYKLVSNKEQPSGPEYTIPWLLSYFKAKTNAASPTENVAQHYPMYIRYDLTDTNVKVTAKQVHNIWDVRLDNNSKKFDMNKQLSELSVKSMTLSTISDEDKRNYGITDIDSLTITL